MKKSLIIILLFSISIVLSSCKEDENCGTVAGNPFSCEPQASMPGSDNQLEPIVAEFFSTSLKKTLCRNIASCNDDLTVGDCEQMFSELNDLDDEIGLTQGLYARFSDIEVAESDDSIVANDNNGITCLYELNRVSCSDPLMENAFQSGLSIPLDGVEVLIDSVESCKDVY